MRTKAYGGGGGGPLKAYVRRKKILKRFPSLSIPCYQSYFILLLLFDYVYLIFSAFMYLFTKISPALNFKYFIHGKKPV